MMNVESVVRAYKRANDTTCRITDNLREHIEQFDEQYETEDLIEVVENNPSDSIYNVINAPFIKLYFDTKRKESALKMREEELEQEVQKQKEFKNEEQQSNLSLGIIEKAMARVMMEEYAPQFAGKVFEDAKDLIEKEYGKIQKKIEYIVPDRGSVDEVVHEEFETVLNFVMADEPVMLIGPAGTGKNVICKQVAKALNLDFHFTNAVTQEYKLTGFIDANGTFHETEFYKAFKDGGIFMLDEIDASIPEVLVILNAAIANRYFDFPNGKIEAHKDFRVVAAGNTFGLGASYEYVGRNQLDAASLDRFAQIEINYSATIENSLTDDSALLNFIRKFRKECQKNGINHVVSYRSITRMDKMVKMMPADKVLKACLIKNLEQDDINMIVKSFKADTIWETAFRGIASETDGMTFSF